MAGWIKMLLGKEVGRKKSYKCVSRLARRLFHHTALSNVAAPDSQCTPTLAAFGKPSRAVVRPQARTYAAALVTLREPKFTKKGEDLLVG